MGTENFTWKEHYYHYYNMYFMFFCFNDGDVYKFMKFAEMMDLFL